MIEIDLIGAFTDMFLFPAFNIAFNTSARRPVVRNILRGTLYSVPLRGAAHDLEGIV